MSEEELTLTQEDLELLESVFVGFTRYAGAFLMVVLSVPTGEPLVTLVGCGVGLMLIADHELKKRSLPSLL